MKNDPITLRLKFDGSAITLIPDVETYGQTMRDDVRALGKEWVEHLGTGLKPQAVVDSEQEFILQSTLDYIASLEAILERLQADPDTSDELLEVIERVLQ